MRKLIFTTVILLTIFISCKKDSIELKSGEGLSAYKNGTVWETNSSWCYYMKSSQEFVISGSKRDAKYYQDEMLHLRVKRSDVVKSVLVKDFSARLSFIIGGDGVYDQYETDTGANNAIHITKLDTVNKTISGYFNVNLKRDPRYLSAKSIQFTQGVFSMTYIIPE